MRYIEFFRMMARMLDDNVDSIMERTKWSREKSRKLLLGEVNEEELAKHERYLNLAMGYPMGAYKILCSPNGPSLRQEQERVIRYVLGTLSDEDINRVHICVCRVVHRKVARERKEARRRQKEVGT